MPTHQTKTGKSAENLELTAGQLEQLVAFERAGMTLAGSEISKAWFRELRNKGLVDRIDGNTVVTKLGVEVLERFRIMCRNLRIQEIF